MSDAIGTTTGIRNALLKYDEIFSKELRKSASKNEITISNGIAITVNTAVFFRESKNVLLLKSWI